MKKISFIIMFVFCVILLSSCNDNRVYKIENVTWKSDEYNIVVTSDQLYAQSYESNLVSDDYGTITFDKTKYYCCLYFGAFFSVSLIDMDDLSTNILNDINDEFFHGSYNLVKVKSEEYKYKITIKLRESAGYYDYCVSNNIEFDEEIVLYGYENE